MTNFVRRVLIAMLLGVLVYGGFVLYAGFTTTKASLDRFAWITFLAAVALATGNYLFRFVKWQYYLRRLDVRGVGTVDSLLVFLSGFVLTITPGKVGEVFKCAILARTHHVPAERTAPIIVAERLTDAIGVIALIVLGSGAFKGGLGWALAGCIAVAVGLVLIVWEKPAAIVLGWAKRRGGVMGRLAPRLEIAFASLRVVAGPSALLIPTALSVVAWALEGIALYVLVVGFGAVMPLGVAVFFYSTASLAGALIPVPGGLGVAETMLEQQLVRLGGMSHGDAVAAMILCRIATLWWAVLVGFLALTTLRLRYPAELGKAEP